MQISNMVKIRLQQIKALLLIGIFNSFSAFVKKETWVISERGKDARDNGYHFYSYLKKHHPEIKTYYIIDKKSADYEKVKDDAVQYGSVKNYWVVATCKKLVSSHYALCVPNIGTKLFVTCGLHNKFHFLQHGIIMNFPSFLHEKNAPMKLFCCGAQPEYEWIKSRFGHAEKVVQYTGLARYDALNSVSEPKRQILVMPTWRGYIHDESTFLSSSFYNNWQTFLSDPRLHQYLRTNGYTLIFYPHYEFQKYLHCFSCDNDLVKLASFEEYDVQTLLKESALLITDYSSVFFDFAYMKKPLLYFQFDKDVFFGKHYQKGYFDFEKIGFGDVCYTSDELILSLEQVFSNRMQLNETYLARINSFFSLRDTNNCQRIYDCITME